MSAIAMQTPSDVIKQLRSELGLTVSEASRMAGIPRATWSAVETGASAHPRPRTKARIARALGVGPSHIWPQWPRPLHVYDVEDPRWEAAVRRRASVLQAFGSPTERRAFGERLISVLDCTDGGEPGPRRDAERWEPLWELGRALVGQPSSGQIAIVDGKLVESQRRIISPATRGEEIRVRRLRGARRR
jgi:transcriptional regulator with XRE-family HTH domain